MLDKSPFKSVVSCSSSFQSAPFELLGQKFVFPIVTLRDAFLLLMQSPALYSPVALWPFRGPAHRGRGLSVATSAAILQTRTEAARRRGGRPLPPPLHP